MYTADIIPRGSSKLLGIQVFVNAIEIEMKEIVVFGDHHDDIEILKGAEIGVAVENVQIEVKYTVDPATQSNEKDGIYERLKHSGLIYQSVKGGKNRYESRDTFSKSRDIPQNF